MSYAVDDTYNRVGIREDLTNILEIISPSDFPLYSAFGKTTASNTYHEWQTVTLSSPAANVQVEGFTASYATSTPTSRLGNYTQIFAKTIEVSRTAKKVQVAGRSDEVAFQTELRMKELVGDFEYAIIRGTATAGGSQTAGRMHAGLIAMLTASGATLTAGSAATVQTTLTEARYNTLLQGIFDNGGNPTQTYCNGFVKRTISAFTTPGSRQINSDSGKVNAAINYYESDFGMQEIILDRVMPKDTIVVIDPNMFKIAVLDAPKMTPMSKVGDGERSMIVAEQTLVCMNQNSSGKYIGILTA